MRQALVISVGTTSEPLKKAIDEMLVPCSSGTEAKVLLLYGRPFEAQEPNPFQIATEIVEYAKARGIQARPLEVPDPEDLDTCLAAARTALREVSSCDRLVVNYTGGTKAMTAALVHAALSEKLAGKLELHYVGGAIRDAHGRVVREAMRLRQAAKTATQHQLEQGIEALRGHRYELAVQLAEPLPETGRPGFFKKAASVLRAWDNFAYEMSEQALRSAAEQAKALEDDEQLGALAGTLIRLRRSARNVVVTVQVLRKLQHKNGRPGDLGDMSLLCADCLENAARCFARGRFDESVLRAYRAVEIAVQGVLLAAGCNPWHPAWDQVAEGAKEKVTKELGRLPSELGLYTGLITWQALMGSELSEGERKKLQELQHTRNHSMLEHGYQSCEEDVARRCQDIASVLVERILGKELGELRNQLRLEA